MRMEQIKAHLAYRKIPRAMKKRVQKFCDTTTKKGVMRENWTCRRRGCAGSCSRTSTPSS